MHFIDTHCHIDLYPNYETLINKTEKEQIYTIAVTNTPSVFHQSAKLALGKKYIRTALGFHPQLVVQRYSELDLMIGMLNETKYIGEIGLDFTTSDKEEHLLQEKAFTTILENCDQLGGKILTIHSRRAASRVIGMIGNSFNGKIILHWFSGSHKELERAILYGFYFSVNPSMVSSTKGQDHIRNIPLDKILTESDGPFIKVSGKVSSPFDMRETVNKISKLYNLSPDSLKEQIYQNFRDILTIRKENTQNI